MKPLKGEAKDVQVEGIIAYRAIFPAVMELMQQGYFTADKLVIKRIALDDVLTKGFKALIKEKNQVKILVKSQPK